ncbi:MAG: PHP domain-containing protein [Clostridia bacterium]|nr:PHP domain-containing protein [Clostridia bacterium]
MFKTELHCHSSEVSECARVSASELVKKYISQGYSTLVLTNHFASFTYNYLKCIDWQDWIDKYTHGYKILKEIAGDKLEVLLGVELRPVNSPNDYLLYGADEAFLREHEWLFRLSVEELSRVTRENGILLIQAHPFRNNMCISSPGLLDGIEVYNGSALGHYKTDSRNDIALAWAKKFDLLCTSGSDLHYPDDPPCAGILTEQKISDASTLVRVLKSKSYSIIGE